MAPVSRGWQSPSEVPAMPAPRSRYSRPSESQTRTPSPRTSPMAARAPSFGVGYFAAHSRRVSVSTAGDEGRVDLVGLPADHDPDRRDHGDDAVVRQQSDGLGIDRLDLTHEPDGDLFAGRQAMRPPPRPEEAGIVAQEPDRPPAVQV